MYIVDRHSLKITLNIQFTSADDTLDLPAPIDPSLGRVDVAVPLTLKQQAEAEAAAAAKEVVIANGEKEGGEDEMDIEGEEMEMEEAPPALEKIDQVHNRVLPPVREINHLKFMANLKWPIKNLPG